MHTLSFPSRPVRAVLASLSLLALAACGGASTGDTADISGSGVVSGPVGGFGSIIVNGVRMNTDRATITNDGVVIRQDDVNIGDTVTIDGTLNGDGTGTANTVITDEFVKGPVSSVDAAAGTFVAMGQLIIVGQNTVLDGVTLTPALVGQNVAVYGSLDADQAVRATRVELKGALTEYEVTGVISTLVGSTFTLNNRSFIVNFSGARIEGSLTVGAYVDVKATSAPAGANGPLTATEVEREDRVPGAAAGRRAEIEGVVSNFNATSRSFQVNGVPVQYSASTVFEDGSAAALADNLRVEVKGTFDANRVLQAAKIEFEQELNIRVTTTLDSVNSSAGTLTILGLTFSTNAQTQFEDDRDDLRPFRLADLRTGDYVEVRGYQDGSTLVASRVERDDADTELELRGPVDSATPNTSFVVLGKTVTTNGSTQFRDANDTAISAAVFYSQLTAGTIVDVDVNTYSGGAIVASEVEIESP